MTHISVIIPAYNAEKTIIQTIESVQLQTFKDFELIIINDGSIDQTPRLIHQIDDSRIKLFSYNNGGLATARNRGLDHSQGKLITFLDADDLWTPNKLELQYQALQSNPSAGLVYSWTLVMDDETGQLNPGVADSYKGNVYQNLFRGNFIASGSNVMFRREVFEAVGYFRADLKAVEDWEYWLRIARQFEFAVVPEYQILYRQSFQAMSADVEKMRSHLLWVHYQELQASPEQLTPVSFQSLAFIHRYLSKLSLDYTTNHEGVKQAAQDLTQALCYFPGIFRERKTQKLMAKILLTGLLPHRLSQAFFGRIRATGAVTLKPQI